jgi:hypothetical protein
MPERGQEIPVGASRRSRKQDGYRRSSITFRATTQNKAVRAAGNLLINTTSVSWFRRSRGRECDVTRSECASRGCAGGGRITAGEQGLSRIPRPPQDRQIALREFLARSPATAAEAADHHGVSQSSISRLIDQSGSSILVVGRARATRYLALREVFDLGSSFPIYEVREDGSSAQLGILHAVLPAASFHFTSRRSQTTLTCMAGTFLSSPEASG